ncbi:Golgi Transport [Coccidioides posadasii str. Silveira]|uniref:Got1 family protein n=3 Tax=Coccidioides posadasii TaxID=199306 RepID=E9D691_COCPS|nr:Got1-like family protein [Coccidioides posadasii C735 delta SOWgp]EER28534.1 Got1-like family protein [Coccidioides posadasii C735 delta SOWgp]EFW17763.1 Got1 family protein [Coccidioides posadasii str. Silveira]KMM68457.1 Got1 family protein [Coccidioides posadasii RMSCC 3488]QVM10231.1 Golgi Transport [Coccidioides posadasii str. Silveira]|eukprot:XP_003070679.1 Got1-like family protein [Coccidioides posadasii C735 delta SOWgp]
MPTMWLSDMQKIGAVFCTAGSLFFFLGILMFFDRSLLAMGNILFVIGLPLILGPQKTLSFFARRQKLLGSVTFALGILLILFRWPLIGFCVELYGLFILFGDFLVTLGAFVGGFPIVGPPLKRALTWVGTLGGRRGGSDLPV